MTPKTLADVRALIVGKMQQFAKILWADSKFHNWNE
jgi:hypothetical protein